MTSTPPLGNEDASMSDPPPLSSFDHQQQHPPHYPQQGTTDLPLAPTHPHQQDNYSPTRQLQHHQQQAYGYAQPYPPPPQYHQPSPTPQYPPQQPSPSSFQQQYSPYSPQYSPSSPPVGPTSPPLYQQPAPPVQQQQYYDQGRDPRQQQQHHNGASAQAQHMAEMKRNSVVIKVGMVGDAQIGKTSLMVKYVEGSFDEDYIQTLGVNFMEKTISIRNTEITFSIWDLGGQREFVNMLPLVCNDAVAILFMFDLTRKSTLNSIKEWYRQARGFNKTAIPFLVGTKYDHFVNFPREDQEEISKQAKKFARAMKASLIFSSTSHSINVQKIFKIVLSKAFDLKCTIPEIENVGEPLLLYQDA